MVTTPKNKLRVKLRKLGNLYSGLKFWIEVWFIIVGLVKKSPATPKFKNVKTIGKFKVSSSLNLTFVSIKVSKGIGYKLRQETKENCTI